MKIEIYIGLLKVNIFTIIFIIIMFKMLLKIKLGPSAIPLSSPNDATDNRKCIHTVKFIINYSIVAVEEKTALKTIWGEQQA